MKLTLSLRFSCLGCLGAFRPLARKYHSLYNIDRNLPRNYLTFVALYFDNEIVVTPLMSEIKSK